MNKVFSATAGVKHKTVGVMQVANYITQNNRGGQNTGRRYNIRHKSFLCKDTVTCEYKPVAGRKL